jgi:uncharacterized cupin superfamily protein
LTSILQRRSSSVPNIYRPEFDEDTRPPGFRSNRARIGAAVGSQRLGCSLWEVPPGEAAYPYHFHYSDEELVFVMRGRPTLRTPEGNRQLEEGEVLHFQVGEQGAHQLVNQTEESVRFLSVSSHGRPDIVIYPDSNKLGVAPRQPHGDGALRKFFHLEEAVDYWDREG